jgi:hypothetical protein
VTGNAVDTADSGGIHLDSTCSSGSYVSGTGNTVMLNTVNEACAGVLGNAAGNTISGNSFFNTTYTTLAGDVCPPVAAGVKSNALMVMAPEGSPVTAQARYVPSQP